MRTLLNRHVLLLLGGVVIAVCLRAWTGDAAVSIYDRVFAKQELPTGGEFVKDPIVPDREYYFTNRWRTRKDLMSMLKHSGLYVTADGGRSWKLLCKSFEFKTLFVHPTTGVMYGVITCRWLAENKDGDLTTHIGDKAIMSEDGKHWKDIAGPREHIANIDGIMTDPDYPSRVCLRICTIRPYVLLAQDDDYSDWTWYRAWDWPKRKTAKQQSRQPAAED